MRRQSFAVAVRIAAAAIAVLPLASGRAEAAPTAYTIVDLGLDMGAFGINDDGTIIAASTVTDAAGHWQGFVIHGGVVTPFGRLATGPMALNNRGWIVANGVSGAFLLRDGVETPLGNWNPLAVSESGLIVGYVSGGYYAGVWEDGTLRYLPNLGGVHGYQALGVNNRDEITGWSQTSSGELRACLWTRVSREADFTVADLGDLGGTRSCAVAINDCGLIVGYMDTAAGPMHAVVWKNGVPTDIDNFSGLNSQAEAVNNRGQVVGNMTGPDSGQPRAFLWEDGVGVELPPMPGDHRSGAYAINGRGDVVGYSHNVETGVIHAVMWTKTVPDADTTAPTLTCPSNVFAAATSASGAVVSYPTPDASDDVDPCVVPMCTPPSGSTFPLGKTTVAVIATDGAGNSSTCSFTVTVGDTTPPVLTLPADITIAATSASGAVVTFAVSATDAMDGAVAVTCAPISGSTFAVGTTIVTCTAVDGSGNRTTGTFRVTVTATKDDDEDRCDKHGHDDKDGKHDKEDKDGKHDKGGRDKDGTSDPDDGKDKGGGRDQDHKKGK